MARGWESKDIESQQEAAELIRRRGRRDSRDPAAVELEAKRKSLLVSRKRVAGELEATQHPRRKEQLQAALDHLDRELAQLGPVG